MEKRLPVFSDKQKICVICEGNEDYKGRADQIETIMKYITVENYADMRCRIEELETIDTVTGSSNFGMFMKLFESEESGWIDEINAVLEE